ncbi:MAG TPA: putative aminohydrolase SsnA [Blastocatellia bacterium]|nr:putative aminohydrolase SsnA [Blastocatellia bacterium]
MLITNASLVTWGAINRILENHALYIEGDRIVDLGPSSELWARYPRAAELDARGQYVMPGNICAHTHFYGAFARGIALPGDPPKDFPEILERLWWKLDKVLTLDDVRYSALVCLIDAIKHGTTTLIDHHASPNAIEGSLDVIAEAVRQAGPRACLCYEVTDRDGPEKARDGIDENLRFIRSATRDPKSTISATFGLHASLTLSDATLEACRNAHDGGFHIHAAEHEADQFDSLKKSGSRVIDRLRKFGVLGPRSIVAHAVHIDLLEAELLRDTGTWVTHQPRSNMNNAVGAADVERLLRLGVKVGLGNDGFSNAMWDEWKAAYLHHKAAHKDPRRMSGATIAQMAMTNNAALANVFFPQASLGLLAPGAFADIIFVDYHPTTPMTVENLPWHILFGFENSMVTTTICAGQVLMKDRRLLFLDEAEIAARSRELAKKAWERFATAGNG